MANKFNSGIIKTSAFCSKCNNYHLIHTDSCDQGQKAVVEPTMTADDAGYTPSEKFDKATGQDLSVTPRFNDTTTVESFLDEVEHSPLIKNYILQILSLSSPDARVKKRSIERSKYSRKLFNAAKSEFGDMNEDAQFGFRDRVPELEGGYLEPGDLAGEDERAALEEPTNFDSENINTILRTHGIYQNNQMVRLTPNGPWETVSSSEPVPGSRIECPHDDCRHAVEDQTAAMGYKYDYSQDPRYGPRRCGADHKVCASCENLPMMKGQKCPTCGRSGDLTAQQAALETKVYDPRSNLINEIAAQINAGPQYENIVGDAQPMVNSWGNDGTSITNSRFMSAIDKLPKRHELGASEFDDPETLDPDSITDTPDQSKPDPDEDKTETDLPKSPPVERISAPATYHHKCQYKCNNGSLIGARSQSGADLRQKIQTSAPYLKAISDARNRIGTLVKLKKIFDYDTETALQPALEQINREFLKCPDAQEGQV